MSKLAELMSQIVDDVANAMQAEPADRQTMEREFMADPEAFVSKYEDCLTPEQVQTVIGDSDT